MAPLQSPHLRSTTTHVSGSGAPRSSSQEEPCTRALKQLPSRSSVKPMSYRGSAVVRQYTAQPHVIVPMNKGSKIVQNDLQLLSGFSPHQQNTRGAVPCVSVDDAREKSSVKSPLLPGAATGLKWRAANNKNHSSGRNMRPTKATTLSTQVFLPSCQLPLVLPGPWGRPFKVELVLEKQVQKVTRNHLSGAMELLSLLQEHQKGAQMSHNRNAQTLDPTTAGTWTPGRKLQTDGLAPATTWGMLEEQLAMSVIPVRDGPTQLDRGLPAAQPFWRSIHADHGPQVADVPHDPLFPASQPSNQSNRLNGVWRQKDVHGWTDHLLIRRIQGAHSYDSLLLVLRGCRAEKIKPAHVAAAFRKVAVLCQAPENSLKGGMLKKVMQHLVSHAERSMPCMSPSQLASIADSCCRMKFKKRPFLDGLGHAASRLLPKMWPGHLAKILTAMTCLNHRSTLFLAVMEEIVKPKWQLANPKTNPGGRLPQDKQFNGSSASTTKTGECSGLEEGSSNEEQGEDSHDFLLVREPVRARRQPQSAKLTKKRWRYHRRFRSYQHLLNGCDVRSFRSILCALAWYGGDHPQLVKRLGQGLTVHTISCCSAVELTTLLWCFSRLSLVPVQPFVKQSLVRIQLRLPSIAAVNLVQVVGALGKWQMQDCKPLLWQLEEELRHRFVCMLRERAKHRVAATTKADASGRELSHQLKHVTAAPVAASGIVTQNRRLAPRVCFLSTGKVDAMVPNGSNLGMPPSMDYSVANSLSGPVQQDGYRQQPGCVQLHGVQRKEGEPHLHLNQHASSTPPAGVASLGLLGKSWYIHREADASRTMAYLCAGFTNCKHTLNVDTLHVLMDVVAPHLHECSHAQVVQMARAVRRKGPAAGGLIMRAVCGFMRYGPPVPLLSLKQLRQLAFGLGRLSWCIHTGDLNLLRSCMEAVLQRFCGLVFGYWPHTGQAQGVVVDPPDSRTVLDPGHCRPAGHQDAGGSMGPSYKAGPMESLPDLGRSQVKTWVPGRLPLTRQPSTLRRHPDAPASSSSRDQPLKGTRPRKPPSMSSTDMVLMLWAGARVGCMDLVLLDKCRPCIASTLHKLGAELVSKLVWTLAEYRDKDWGLIALVKQCVSREGYKYHPRVLSTVLMALVKLDAVDLALMRAVARSLTRGRMKQMGPQCLAQCLVAFARVQYHPPRQVLFQAGEVLTQDMEHCNSKVLGQATWAFGTLHFYHKFFLQRTTSAMQKQRYLPHHPDHIRAFLYGWKMLGFHPPLLTQKLQQMLDSATRL